MKKIIIGLILLSLAACGKATPRPEELQAAIAGTITAYTPLPTFTPLPTNTAYPTNTPYPTLTNQPTLTPYPTNTPFPTYTPKPTQTPHIIIITITSSPTPLYTPTIIPTPTITQTPTKTPTITLTPNVAKTATAEKFAELTADKSPGNYLVNVDIAPGVWRSQGSDDGCYWERLTRKGDIISNYFGMAGGTIYIAPTDFEVRMDEDCGDWIYLGPP